MGGRAHGSFVLTCCWQCKQTQSGRSVCSQRSWESEDDLCVWEQTQIKTAPLQSRWSKHRTSLTRLFTGQRRTHRCDQQHSSAPAADISPVGAVSSANNHTRTFIITNCASVNRLKVFIHKQTRNRLCLKASACIYESRCGQNSGEAACNMHHTSTSSGF